MLAVLAAVAFFLALLKVKFGEVNLVTLGLLFLALHLIYPWAPWAGRRSGPPA
jgi:hypothetical protein